MAVEWQIRDNCIQHLHTAANNQSRPWFVGCGLHKPHVPWKIPKEFFDIVGLYDEIKLAANTSVPEKMPIVAWHPPADVNGTHIYQVTFIGLILIVHRHVLYTDRGKQPNKSEAV